MNIIVPIKQVPDLVEELEIDSSGKSLDQSSLKMKLSEFDDHALEEALILKEESGATVTAIAFDSEDVDKILFTAAAKGADKIIKVTGLENPSSHQAAQALAQVIKAMPHDLVMTGVQAVDDRDGQLAVLLAHYLGVPHVSVVTSVKVNGQNAVVSKEYGAGLVAEYEVKLPMVVGVQAARQSPRYVPVAKVRQTMKTATLEEVAATNITASTGSSIKKVSKPESGAGAEMIEGSAEEQASKIIQLLKDKGIK
ncbi:MAG: electron transfer flavoprotein subunit beta/FixA family protein [Bacteroidota bacterium]